MTPFAHSAELDTAITDNVRAALTEDVGPGDISAALIDPSRQARAHVVSRESGVFCGLGWVQETCAQVDPQISLEFHVADGDNIQPDQRLFTINGPARGLLTAERTLLNFVGILSGTATATRRYVDLISGTGARLLDTRKTIPGLRLGQKYAVYCGGGSNHRFGLFDAFLIKENHLVAAGGVSAAVGAAQRKYPESRVEVEVETLDQLKQAIDAGADIALIDNFSVADTHAAVAVAGHHIELESSGGIDEKTITDIAATGVNYISVGTITKQVSPLDLSMRFTGEIK
ncbi:MAG: carboxylating nicotinate-nucleotide diphosphorylase [Pseudomonadales bacterium]